MKQEEAKHLIIREWDRWVQTQPIDAGGPTGRDSLKFFLELQDARSALLDFQTRGRDQWQVVHAWLIGARRLQAASGGSIFAGIRARPANNRRKKNSIVEC
jgi:hypothetical protein